MSTSRGAPSVRASRTGASKSTPCVTALILGRPEEGVPGFFSSFVFRRLNRALVVVLGLQRTLPKEVAAALPFGKSSEAAQDGGPDIAQMFGVHSIQSGRLEESWRWPVCRISSATAASRCARSPPPKKMSATSNRPAQSGVGLSQEKAGLQPRLMRGRYILILSCCVNASFSNSLSIGRPAKGRVFWRSNSSGWRAPDAEPWTACRRALVQPRSENGSLRS